MFVLLPALDSYRANYYGFDVLVGLVLACKVVLIVIKILEQASVDIFFIDREYKRGQSEVNGWRTIFVANELNELQTMRLVSTEATLVWYAFFMLGEGWLYTAEHDPEMNTTASRSPLNFVLQFFISALVLVSIAAVQYALKRVLSIWFPLRSQEFVDLCSFTNISIFIFDQSLHGYYVHGHAPLGTADATAEGLIRALEFEADGRGQPRGLLASDPNLQTFEIYIPFDMRQRYERLYSLPLQTDIE